MGSGNERQNESPFSGMLTARIPEELLTDDMKESQLTSLQITGPEYTAFNLALTQLRDDQRVEYLDDKQLKDRLWFLLCEVFINRKRYKKELSELSTKITRFLSEIYKAVEEYEVLFRIDNFDVGDSPIHFWDCEIARHTRDELILSRS